MYEYNPLKTQLDSALSAIDICRDDGFSNALNPCCHVFSAERSHFIHPVSEYNHPRVYTLHIHIFMFCTRRLNCYMLMTFCEFVVFMLASGR